MAVATTNAATLVLPVPECIVREALTKNVSYQVLTWRASNDADISLQCPADGIAL
jgi:hypothetical protein